jgi:predicted Rossmann fold nucleotide-binding protein DprA/Smf involved in DNA uptake
MPGKLTEAHRQALKLFRERHGDVPETVKQYAKEFRQRRKRITEALREAPATVPELAAKTGMPADQVLWHIAGMRKYGEAREAVAHGDYVKYELVKKSE